MPIGVYKRHIYDVVCSICGTTYQQKRKPIENPRCKSCMKKAHDSSYKQRNPDKVSSYSKSPKAKEYSKRYYQKNKKAILSKQKPLLRAYYVVNRDHILAKEEARRRGRGEKKRGLSGTESIALNILSDIFPDTEIRTNDRRTITNPITGVSMELDFYLPSLRLAIELNGITHYKPVFGMDKFNRQVRNDRLKKFLCRLKRIDLVSIPLEDGKHYDRFDSEHKLLRKTIESYIKQWRDDKNAEECLFQYHIREENPDA